MVYGFITLLPIIWHDSPYNSPHSTPAWFLYVSIHNITFKILAFITSSSFWSFQTWKRCEDLKYRYQGWRIGGMEKAAEESASERSSEIDVQIFDWTISALGDDDSLKRFLEAIPGFFNSKLVNHLESDVPEELLKKFKGALHGFLGRTWSSNSVNDSEKLHRLDISMNAMNQVNASCVWSIPFNILFEHWDEVPQTVEMGHTLAPWCTPCTSSEQCFARYAQATVARVLVSVRDRNDRWVALAARVFDVPERDLWDNIALGDDSVLLAILIRLTRQSLRSDHVNYLVLEEFSKLDICDTLLRLQHLFCTLWNEILQEARNQGPLSTHVRILRRIRHPYITLHQDTDADLAAFSASTYSFDLIMFKPSSYPFCNTASHRPDSIEQLSAPNSCEVPHPTPPGDSPDASSHPPTNGGDTTSRQAEAAEQVNNATGPPSHSNPTIISEIGAIAHGPAAAPHDITSTAILSHPLIGSEQQDLNIVVPSGEPGTSQILFTASTHAPTTTLAPIPSSLPNTPSESHDAGIASDFNSSHFSPPAIHPSIPASRPTGSAMLPRLRARGLVNTGNICFANTVLQLLVSCPSFRNLFRELGDTKWQRGAGVPETGGGGGGATPLVDATVRFFKEFIVEESSSVKQQSQPATSKANKQKKEDNFLDTFEPTYMYGAMKEKRQLKPLFVRSRAHVTTTCADLCWSNIYRTANSRMRKSFFVYTLTRLTMSCLSYSILLVIAGLPVLHLKSKGARYLLTWEVKVSWCVNNSIPLH